MTQPLPPEGGYVPSAGSGTPQYGAPGYPPPQYGALPYGAPQYGAPQYGAPGYPPGGWGYAPAGPPAAKPSSNIGWAIAAIFLFWPLAIPAFIFSSRVDEAWNRGDAVTAQEASDKTRMFGIIALVVGILVAVLVLIVIIAVGVAVTNTTNDIITNLTPQPFPT